MLRARRELIPDDAVWISRSNYIPVLLPPLDAEKIDRKKKTYIVGLLSKVYQIERDATPVKLKLEKSRRLPRVTFIIGYIKMHRCCANRFVCCFENIIILNSGRH